MASKRVQLVGVGSVAVLAATTGVGTSAANGSDASAFDRAGGWQPQRLVAKAGAPKSDVLDPDYYRVVMAPGGRATAVWVRQKAPRRLKMSHRRPGSGWTKPVTVAKRKPQSLGDVAVDGRGHVTILWSQYRPAQETSRAVVRTWRPGKGLGKRKILGRGDTGELATNDRGDLLATRENPGGTRTFFKPAGGHWRNKRVLPGYGWSIDMNGKGRTYAVAGRLAGVRMSAFKPRANRWRDPWTIADIDGADADPSIAANERGDLIVGWFWSKSDDDTYAHDGADAMYRRAGGSFGRVHQLYDSRAGTSRDFNDVAVGISARGVGHVAWIGKEPRNGYFRGPLRTVRRTPGGDWSQHKLLARDVSDLSITLSTNPRGAVLVTGVHAGGDQRLLAVRRPAGGPYGKQRLLTAGSAKTRASSDLAHSGAAVALYSPRGKRTIFARSFGR